MADNGMADNGAHPAVARTERGLVVAGTRITLYALLDCLHDGWPPKLIRDWFGLTDSQIDGVLAYIDANRTEVEREYEEVLRQAEEIRQYWEARNRDRIPPRQESSDTPERAELRKRLEEWKARIGQA